MTKRANYLIRADAPWNNYDPPKTPRLGILMVPDEFGLSRLKPILPTGHAIVSTRVHPLMFFTEAMIEGPMMPEAPSGQAPRTVRLICTTYNTTAGATWRWEHLPERTWTSVVS